MMRVARFGTNPLLEAGDAEVGDNVNGASVVRVPAWVKGRLGNFYMYFAHHEGTWIRMAYADSLEGPWKVLSGGTLPVNQSAFAPPTTVELSHVASPDVHVDEGRKKLVMFYHGGYLAEDFRDAVNLKREGESGGKVWTNARLAYRQATAVAESEDGLRWRTLPGVVGLPYWRRFEWAGRFYALAMPGMFYQSSVVSSQLSVAGEGLSGFQLLGLELFSPRMRHAAVLVEGDRLKVFYSNAADSPERIVMSTIALDRDWRKWRLVGTEDVLSPEQDYEGGDLKVTPSERGVVHGRVRQLRDPYVMVDEGRTYLFYSIAGEYGIAGAELVG